MGDQYEISCPFCGIASAYPHSQSTSGTRSSGSSSLSSFIPENPDINKVTPGCFLVLSAPNVMAFLDIMPMTMGHLLVTCRPHREKVADMAADEGADVGEKIPRFVCVETTTEDVDHSIGFWLPLLAKMVTKVTGVSDYNIVQNNGVRAAQVVPHVHFHIIPRPGHVPELKSKSWTMFGRGQRDDLDDEEGIQLAAEMRRVLSAVVEEHESERTKRGKL